MSLTKHYANICGTHSSILLRVKWRYPWTILSTFCPPTRLWSKKQYHYWPGQAQSVAGGWGSQISRQSAHEGGKVVSRTHRPPLIPGNSPGTHFYWRLSRPQGHSAAGRIMSMKNSSDTIGNRTRDLPICSAVSQPTAPPRGPGYRVDKWNLILHLLREATQFFFLEVSGSFLGLYKPPI